MWYPEMKVLMTYSSGYGSTKEVAERITEILVNNSDLQLTLLSIDDVQDVTNFDAIIVGSSVRADRPLANVRDFFAKHSDTLEKKHLAIFLRKSFSVAEPTAFERIKFRLRRDDGAAVYLNGISLFTHHLQAGGGDETVLFAEHTVGDVAEHIYYVETVEPELLVAGENVIAVQVHQVNEGSSDLFFDLAVEGLQREDAELEQRP